MKFDLVSEARREGEGGDMPSYCLLGSFGRYRGTDYIQQKEQYSQTIKPPRERPCQGGSHVACLNFKTSRVGVYKCLSLIVGLAVTVAIWPREVVSCRDFILRAVATFWAMSLVGIYPGRASRELYRLVPLFLL